MHPTLYKLLSELKEKNVQLPDIVSNANVSLVFCNILRANGYSIDTFELTNIATITSNSGLTIDLDLLNLRRGELCVIDETVDLKLADFNTTVSNLQNITVEDQSQDVDDPSEAINVSTVNSDITADLEAYVTQYATYEILMKDGMSLEEARAAAPATCFDILHNGAHAALLPSILEKFNKLKDYQKNQVAPINFQTEGSRSNAPASQPTSPADPTQTEPSEVFSTQSLPIDDSVSFIPPGYESGVQVTEPTEVTQTSEPTPQVTEPTEVTQTSEPTPQVTEPTEVTQTSEPTPIDQAERVASPLPEQVNDKVTTPVTPVAEDYNPEIVASEQGIGASEPETEPETRTTREKPGLTPESQLLLTKHRASLVRYWTRNNPVIEEFTSLTEETKSDWYRTQIKAIEDVSPEASLLRRIFSFPVTGTTTLPHPQRAFIELLLMGEVPNASKEEREKIEQMKSWEPEQVISRLWKQADLDSKPDILLKVALATSHNPDAIQQIASLTTNTSIHSGWIYSPVTRLKDLKAHLPSLPVTGVTRLALSERADVLTYVVQTAETDGFANFIRANLQDNRPEQEFKTRISQRLKEISERADEAWATYAKQVEMIQIRIEQINQEVSRMEQQTIAAGVASSSSSFKTKVVKALKPVETIAQPEPATHHTVDWRITTKQTLDELESSQDIQKQQIVTTIVDQLPDYFKNWEPNKYQKWCKLQAAESAHVGIGD